MADLDLLPRDAWLIVEILYLAVGQLAVGLIVAATVMLVGLIFIETIKAALRKPVTYPTAVDQNVGAWQYDDAYFDKIEEFRNDFA